MKTYVCTVCGYVYDEEKGIPEAGIAPGTKWEELPENWVCPLCGASKSEFREQGAPQKAAVQAAPAVTEEYRALNARELSILCSNLARGCEKQYRQADAASFRKLVDYFLSTAEQPESSDFGTLLQKVEQDLAQTMPVAMETAKAAGDRGAQRALTWSDKVTRILKSLLTRYEKEGAAMTEGQNVYVCTICGFVYVGENPPALCPVCKVPSWKFEQVMGR